MRARLEVSVSSGRLRFEPVTGRRTFYANLTIGARTWWVQRWDVDRTRPPRYRPRFVSRDGLMGWTWGVRSVRAPA